MSFEMMGVVRRAGGPILVIVLLVGGATACSGADEDVAESESVTSTIGSVDERSGGAVDEARSPSSEGSSAGGPGSSPSSTAPTTTSALPPPPRDVPLTSEEAACVEERAGNPDELSDEELRDVSEDCVQVLSLAPAMVQGLNETYPGVYSEAHLSCLVEGYAALDGEDLQALTNAGLFPDDEGAADGVLVLAGMFEDCDATVPPDLAEAAAE